MTFTGRIRLYLILVALLPVIVVWLLIYDHAESQRDRQQRRRAQQAIEHFDLLHRAWLGETDRALNKLASDEALRRNLRSLASGRSINVRVDPRRFGLDFLEIVDSSNIVRASWHRSGLIGQRIDVAAADTSDLFVSVEYDVDGAHAAAAALLPLGQRGSVYAGRYLRARDLAPVQGLLGVDIDLYLDDDSARWFGRWEPRSLYSDAGRLRALLLHAENPPLSLVASFPPVGTSESMTGLLMITALVGLLSAAVAIGLGMFITGRAKREIDNLRSASARVAAGDFSTPVMAWSEGEFSELADSLSHTMEQLKGLQQRLSATERIAAWRQMGRKVAHEIKNPLTPITLGIDDLHRSYIEKQPNFDKILGETVGTIKSELSRMRELLDRFVNFARMEPAQPVMTKLPVLTERVRGLYRSDIETGRVVIDDRRAPARWRLDADAMQQALVNLIKNGLESGDEATVRVSFVQHDTRLHIEVADTGPGFSEKRLQSPFEPYETTKPGGSGLGLMIVWRIVHDHGGELELANRKDGGALVTIEIPE
jgi:signal transduction histidine kinase